MTQLDVCIVIHSLDRGGSGKVAGYLARGFAALGMTVELVMFATGGAIEPIVLPVLESAVQVHHLGSATRWRALDLVLGVPALVAHLRRRAPRVVLAAANNVALPVAFAFRWASLPGARLYLKTTNPIASSRHTGLLRAVRRAGYRLIFRWTEAVLTLSEAEAREMAVVFPSSARGFRAVANPYVTPAMLARPVKIVRRTGKTVIAVARLTVQKRLERLIAAFALIDDAETRLIILGEGEARAALTAQIEASGLTDRVSMPGHVADVVPALHAADLFVLTSDYEGLPAVVLEAMAANCPVLATACFPSARELLAEPGCAIIEDTRAPALAAQIEAQLAQPRPQTLRAVAERYSIANGVASHAAAIRPE